MNKHLLTPVMELTRDMTYGTTEVQLRELELVT